MTKLTNEIVNSTNGLSSGTYVVEDTIKLSQDLIIPNDVTLIFQGGKFEVADNCTKEIEIKGSDTRLEAPICNIFGKGINVEGSWDIDRAYPQWFEIEKEINSTEVVISYDDNQNKIVTEKNNRYPDYSSSIQKAIKMKQVGEVFLKAGKYTIANPIHINKGIQFIGENSQPIDKYYNGCTRIFPVAEGTNPFNDTYMVYINSYLTKETNSETNEIEKTEQAIDIYIDQSTIIKNICFTDFIKKSEDHQFTQKCILAGGGVHLDRIIWQNFLQGIKYTNTYNDTRSITNCSLKHDYRYNDASKDVYAIDTGWLGDALKFEHNAIHDTCNGKGLRLYNCGGASIQGNIINSDVLIDGCKAIIFNANHIEGGRQIEIINSSVTTNNNYIHRGNKPNFYIHSKGGYNNQSIVSLNNDMFIHLKTSNADYDICIDKETTLKVSNLFRYDITYTVFDKIYPCGINICKDIVIYENGNIKTYKPFDEFNNFSYITSEECYIQPRYNLRLHANIKELNTPAINNLQSNGAVSWLCESGSYRYYYQIVWDKTRGIKKTMSSINNSDCTNRIQWYLGDSGVANIKWIEKNENGVLIELSENASGNCTMVRLIREKVIGDSNLNNLEFEAQEVYIPLCGSRYLYDNGISICGYKWSEPFQFTLQETSNKNMEMFRIIDGNVECFTKREGGITPTFGWKLGDVIHNIGNNPSTIIVSEDINQ